LHHTRLTRRETVPAEVRPAALAAPARRVVGGLLERQRSAARELRRIHPRSEADEGEPAVAGLPAIPGAGPEGARPAQQTRAGRELLARGGEERQRLERVDDRDRELVFSRQGEHTLGE